MKKEFICIQCPRGCHLSIDEDSLAVEGNFCPRGALYAKNELTDPKRVVTSTVKVHHSDIPMCSVRTREAVSKKEIFSIIKEIGKIELEAPVHVGDVIIANVCNTKVDVIATKEMKKTS